MPPYENITLPQTLFVGGKKDGHRIGHIDFMFLGPAIRPLDPLLFKPFKPDPSSIKLSWHIFSILLFKMSSGSGETAEVLLKKPAIYFH